jgi:integrase
VVALEYRFGGKEKRIALGIYPSVSLKVAREKRDSVKQQLANGVDPSEARKANRVAQDGADQFETIAREWYARFSPGWNPGHGDRILRRLERDIFPWLGKRPIGEIKPAELLSVLRRIENRGALETAHRAMQNCGQVFRYAVATGRAERDPTADLKGALPPAQEKHHASITEPTRVGDLRSQKRNT